MSNVIPMPGLEIEMQFSEIEGLVDAMLYMHEAADDGDRKRIMEAEISMLHVIKDKIRAGQGQLLRMPGHYGRKAS
jgi:hypothetical protein